VERGHLDGEGVRAAGGHGVLHRGEPVDVERGGHALGEQPVEVGAHPRVGQRRLADDHERAAGEAVHVVVDDAGQDEAAAGVDHDVGAVVVRRVARDLLLDQVVFDEDRAFRTRWSAGAIDHHGIEDEGAHTACHTGSAQGLDPTCVIRRKEQR
jgi:hypothetical protein